MRMSIYAGEPIEKALAGHENKSGRLNELAARYAEIVRREMPALAEGEWLLLCDILNSTMMDNSSVRALWAEVEDSATDGASEKWRVDVPALASRLRAMRYVELIAILDAVERFWRAGADGGHRERLELAGAKLAATG